MPPQSTVTHREEGLCILSLDAGGPRAISQLRILTKVIGRLSSETGQTSIDRPCAVFDMIGGTGTAGFIAILLVVLGMTIESAVNEFAELSEKILGKRGLDSRAITTELKNHISTLLERYDLKPETRLLDKNERSRNCKLVVPLSYKHDAESTCNLRNYNVRQEQTLNVTILQALMATLATPPLFLPTSIFKDAATFEYISGDIALSNPTREIISEAHGVFGQERRIACLLSLGCGHPGVIDTPDNADMASWNLFLEKLASSSERQARSIDSQMGRLGIYFRFGVTIGLEKRASKLRSEVAEIITYTDTYLEDVSVSEDLDRCIDFLKIRDGVATLEQLTYSGGERILPPSLPPLTQTFVMRTKPWSFIEQKLLGAETQGGSRMLVVSGMGGCGKTQLILKFMQVHKEQFASMFFIDGSSKGRLLADIVRHVRSLGPEHSQKTFEDCLLFLAQPSPNGRRLILYDNVDDPNMELAPLLPHGKSCTIIITSRDRLMGGLSPEGHLELDVMSNEEAVELLLHDSTQPTSITAQDRREAHDIAEALGCLPLALQQARSYMFQTKCSARTYLERLGTSRDRLLSMALNYQLDNQSISTYAAFDASFDKLALRTQQLLRLLAFFHWSNFPLELIFLAARHNFNDYETKYIEYGDNFKIGRALVEEIFLRNGIWDPTIMDEMTKSIQNYSLITLVPGIDTTLLQMHPLAHGWIKSCTPVSERDRYQSAAVLLLALGARRDHMPVAKYLSSHVTYMSPIWDQLHVNDAEAFGRILTNGGLFNDALKFRERVVAELRNQLDTQSLLFSDSLWLLAVAYSNVGRFPEAEVLQAQVMSLRKGSVRENDPITLSASISLANTYRILRRFDDAEALQTEVLRLRRETFGDQHVETMTALNHLARTYSDSGRLEKAETLQVEVLALSKELRGERHPDTLIASGDLAYNYLRLRRPKEALPLQLEVVRLSKEVRGDRHPDTSRAMSQLALIYSALGEFHDAEMLQEEVQRLSKELRGERHPVTIAASSSLATIYYELGRFQEAEALQEEVLRRRKEVLGERHLDTIAASGYLATTYARLGRAKDAEWLLEEMWRRRKEVLGEGHSDTIDAAKMLAWSYWRAQRNDESRVLFVKIMELIGHTRGENHPDYITARSNWELVVAVRSRRRIHLDLLEWRREHLPENHPDTISALMNVAQDYRNYGRLGRAEKLQLEVVKLKTGISGERHPDTVSAIFTLGLTYQALGRLAEAEALQLKVLRILKETRGERHPDTILTSGTLANIYYDLGRFEEAEKLEEEVLALQTEVLGEHRKPVIKPRIQSGTLGRLKFRGRRVFWRGVALATRITD